MRLRVSLPARVWLSAVGVPSVLGALVLGVHAVSVQFESLDRARDTLAAMGSVRAATVVGVVETLEADARLLAASTDARRALEGDSGASALLELVGRVDGDRPDAARYSVALLDAALDRALVAGVLDAEDDWVDLLRAAADAGRSGYVGVTRAADGRAAVLVLEPVVDPVSGRTAGWVALAADASVLAVTSGGASAAASLCSWMLVDRLAGVVIAGSRPTDGNTGGLRSDGVMAAVAAANPAGWYRNLRSEEVLGQVNDLPYQGWAILTEVPRAAIEAGADVRLAWGLGVLIFIALTSVLIGSRLSRGVLRWAEELNEVTRRVAEGDYSARVVHRGDDEFTHVAQGFNRMAESVASAQRRAETACAEASRQSKAKGDFLANMTHEIRTPLTAILGYAQVARSDSSLDQEQTERIDSIIRSARHLADLVTDVLEMAKVESGSMEISRRTVEIEQVFREVHEMFALTASKKDLELRIELQPGLPERMITDRRKLRQIVINLVGNALRYTERGSVHVQVSPDPERRGILAEVRDTGRGIAAQDLPGIFAAFDQGGQMPAVSGGTGLGLSISRTYAELLGGSLDATSEVGKGSVFRLRLPDLARPGAGMQAGRRPRIGSAAAPVSGLHVLLVDDAAEVRTAVSRVISGEGGKVSCVCDGASALEVLGAREVDLALVDLRMRGMDGVETIRRIRADPAGARVAIVAMSGTAVQAEVDAVLEAGADDFVRKPLDFDDLWERVDYAVRKHQQQSKGSTMVTERALGGVAESLRGVPREALSALASLALEGDISALRDSVAALAEEHPQAATALEPIVRAFRYEDLVELCGGGGGA